MDCDSLIKISLNMSDCIFCKIVAGEIPCHKIYEDDAVIAFLDIHPVAIGHTLIVPKSHASDALAGSSEDATAMMRVIHQLAPKMLRALGADGLNIGSNIGASAGQDVFHTHLHLMPRVTGTPRAFVQMEVTQAELAGLADKIRQSL